MFDHDADYNEAYVNALFKAELDRPGEYRANPVTGEMWLKGERTQLHKKRALAALRARAWFRSHGPGVDLPLNRFATREMMADGGTYYLVGAYARSLSDNEYVIDGHPVFETYARGVMASLLAPPFIRNDLNLLELYPPNELIGLMSGLIWRPRGMKR